MIKSDESWYGGSTVFENMTTPGVIPSDSYSQGLVLPGEDLRNGIWPRPFEFWMTAFYLALFIIRPWEQLLPSLSNIHFERLYALTMIGVVTMTCGFRLQFNSQTLAVLLFLACLIISGLTAWSPDLAWDEIYVYLTLVVFYMVLVSVIRTPYQLVAMIASYLAVMGVYLAKSQWEFFVNGQHRFDQGVTRLVGIEPTFGGPNALAMSIVVSLPMLLFLYRIKREFIADWPQLWQKWFVCGLLAYLMLAVTSLFLTNSRSGMVSFVVFVVFVSLRGVGLARKLKYITVGIVLLISIWFMLPQDIQGRFDHMGSGVRS